MMTLGMLTNNATMADEQRPMHKGPLSNTQYLQLLQLYNAAAYRYLPHSPYKLQQKSRQD
jgi:hypothetical protein